MIQTFLDPFNTRPQRRVIYGVIPAIVTNIKDPEKRGRIKVCYKQHGEDNESDWIRMISFMAGKNRGAFFLPDVGDEVLVAFHHGDINSPYVLGALWSTEDVPPEKNEDGKNNIKIIRSRSGHKIIICDDHEKKKERVEIITKAGHQLVLDDENGKEKIIVKDKTGSNKMIIDSVKKAINIESTNDIFLKSKNITIEASANLKMKAAKTKSEASGTMDMKAGGIATLKGSLVKIN
jgi:uncharacterized protein involved in type VI secretion and phage assembly